ncbi:selenocysteine-specific translation elongation factor [Corynebacterium suedekumii]|uniref:Selenocysteine-specific translation elongation factor n=2 Tax=Corynebacterium TaxID=1716 RepID=A0ABY8VK66_9CORY|nr:selenocysteine-specific translation elongation factor [Corynebacterium suedekumii]WIM69381.1 selenocysteine-specific translation elongation factor [Corynebacterium suedekumii]
MYVVATAGHVDHGKSTLVTALTGMEPDRWEEEKRRGLTIDLGFVWTTLPSGRDVAFVDVPGHERFMGNMLAGVGPSPVVCFIVAADEGWQAQSTDHRDAVQALGIDRGVIVLTRADRADESHRAEVAARVRHEFAGTPLANAPVVTVSARTGEGLDELRRVLDEVLADAGTPDDSARVRLWIDRSFTVRGSGTVVTGTLAAGSLAVDDRLLLHGASGPREVTVRGLHSQNAPHRAIGPVNRVAVNLRGESTDEIHRGDALLTPGAWPDVDVIDVRRVTGEQFTQAPSEVVVHVGTAALEAAFRPFGQDHARLTLRRSLPLVIGDRLVLRRPGDRAVYAGVQILDVDPPELTRRGDGHRRAASLAATPDGGDVLAEVARRGAVRHGDLLTMGFDVSDTPPTGVVALRDWWIHVPRLGRWRDTLLAAVQRQAEADPLAAGLSRGAALGILDLPDGSLLGLVVAAAKLEQSDGLLRLPGTTVDLGAAEPAVARLETRLRARPFDAPEADELRDLGLGPKELAAAERAGRLLRLEAGVILLPDAPAVALARLRGLDQPFTTSQARKALDTTRRVAIPLLEHLDSQGKTRRLDGGHRKVR